MVSIPQLEWDWKQVRLARLPYIKEKLRTDLGMAYTANLTNQALPKEMEEHTYPIMYQIEGRHWWFVGRRHIISSFLSKLFPGHETSKPAILDVG